MFDRSLVGVIVSRSWLFMESCARVWDSGAGVLERDNWIGSLRRVVDKIRVIAKAGYVIKVLRTREPPAGICSCSRCQCRIVEPTNRLASSSRS